MVMILQADLKEHHANSVSAAGLINATPDWGVKSFIEMMRVPLHLFKIS